MRGPCAWALGCRLAWGVARFSWPPQGPFTVISLGVVLTQAPSAPARRSWHPCWVLPKVLLLVLSAPPPAWGTQSCGEVAWVVLPVFSTFLRRNLL